MPRRSPKHLAMFAYGSFLAMAGSVIAQPTADSPGKTFTVTLTRGSRLMIDARINGRAVKALIDSAAEATIVDRGLARALKLEGGETVTGQGSGKSTFDAALIAGVTLEALGLSLPGQTVAVADLGDVGRRLLGHPIEVILGREIFDAARLSIDINGRRIAVVPRTLEPRGVRLGLVTEHGVETVPVRVESGVPLRATFDLGNGSHVLISASLAARMGWLSDGRPVTTDRGGGLGGEATRRVVVLRSMEVAGRRFNRITAAIDPQSSASDVNIGVSILRHFLITTDFADHAVWLASRD
jgi:predicted aspartyl protease